MQSGSETQHKVDRALLCLNDSDTELAVKMRILGQPLVYHLLKALYSLGISEIALSVETVAPELLNLIDRLKSEGLEPVVLRKGADALQFAGKPGAFLLQNAAIWVAPGLMKQIAEGGDKLLLTLPEDTRFGSFERIDLNRRWAGIAVLDGSLAAQSPPIAEGWSIDSCLLRAALQAGYPDTLLTDEALNQVAHAQSEHPQQLQKLIGAGIDTADASNGPISHLADVAIRKFAAAGWWQGAIDFGSPAVAVFAAMSAFFAHSTIALSLGTVALLARDIRARWRHVSYMKPSGDAVDLAIQGILLLTLYIGLNLTAPPLEAAFLASTLAGVLTLGQVSRSAIPKQLASPLIVAAALALASISGHLIVGVKVAIIALIASLIVGHLRRQG
jgi:hypothetical protein